MKSLKTTSVSRGCCALSAPKRAKITSARTHHRKICFNNQLKEIFSAFQASFYTILCFRPFKVSRVFLSTEGSQNHWSNNPTNILSLFRGRSRNNDNFFIVSLFIQAGEHQICQLKKAPAIELLAVPRRKSYFELQDYTWHHCNLKPRVVAAARRFEEYFMTVNIPPTCSRILPAPL